LSELVVVTLDGESVAYSGTDAGANQDLPMIYDYNVVLETAPRRLTFEGESYNPVWSPEGEQIAFASQRTGTASYDLFTKRVTDDSAPELLWVTPGRQRPQHWLAGDTLLFQSGTGPAQNSPWLMEVADSATAQPYFTAEGNQLAAAISPDGELAAYQSNESESYEVYVRSFPTPRQPAIVSSGGGQFPRWSPDGSTLYYWKHRPRPGVPDSLFAATVGREPTFAVLSTEFVLAGDYLLGDENNSANWDLHPEGDRFIVPRAVSAPATPSTDGVAAEPERFLIVTNWFTELRVALGES
jgi:Tol biopolymer transport system component